MKRIIALMLTLVFLLSVSTAQAGITESGSLSHPAATWPSATSNIYIGNVSYGVYPGYVTIDDGTDLTTNGQNLGVGWHSDCNGSTLTLDGNNASDPTTLTVGKTLYAGYTGNGIVNVQGNAELFLNAANALFGFAVGGSGELNVTDGGKVTANVLYFNIGYSGQGTAVIGTQDSTGPTCTLLTQALYVSRSADPSSLTIWDDGYVKAYGDAKIGYSGDADAFLKVSGGLFEVTGTAKGARGQSVILVENGGVIDSQRGILAEEIKSGVTPLSLAMVTGDGSQWVCEENMVVGGAGIGILNIANGGEVIADVLSIDEDIALAAEGAVADSRIDILGGLLTITGDVDDDIATFLSAIAGSDTINVLTTGYALVPVTSATAGVDYTLTYDAGAGTTTLQGMTVPEPGTIILLLGLVFAGLILRKK